MPYRVQSIFSGTRPLPSLPHVLNLYLPISPALQEELDKCVGVFLILGRIRLSSLCINNPQTETLLISHPDVFPVLIRCYLQRAWKKISWKSLQGSLPDHIIDLMALDSNTQHSLDWVPFPSSPLFHAPLVWC